MARVQFLAQYTEANGGISLGIVQF
ncbi:uncharacterized protein G2W53_008030 [Senna tora]|uniref:Uncharacterized protein n=1 Tax=Senna tora TaxID=362788 RepID=A0A834X9B0_9FABA|nr:uncharacterized protein G2W53_008030 [Senna tora]